MTKDRNYVPWLIGIIAGLVSLWLIGFMILTVVAHTQRDIELMCKAQTHSKAC